MLNKVGKKTKCVARFSTVGGEKGSADSARDPRGFSVKFYTEEGNWDWVFNNTPIFFLRDPANFPTFIHTQKRNPQTNLKDATMFWDYLSSHQESAHQGRSTARRTRAARPSPTARRPRRPRPTRTTTRRTSSTASRRASAPRGRATCRCCRRSRPRSSAGTSST